MAKTLFSGQPLMFDPLSSIPLAQREHELLAFWRTDKIFERLQAERLAAPLFTFYDGPPFATGLPHYGHLLAAAIKDAVCRFKSMTGYHVPRRFGWDCHGLPVESLVEKGLSLSGAASIEAFGIDRFNEACRESVLLYTNEWKESIERLGRWVEIDSPYRTMDRSFMESVWWVFKSLFDKGLIYSGYKVMPFSWKLGTPLSNFEASENYKEVDDPSLVLSFVDEKEEDLHYLVWTTTAWTLVSNMALALHPDTLYVEILYEKKRYILAKERLETVFANKNFEVLFLYRGKELVGRRYRALFPFFLSKRSEGAFVLVEAPFVSTKEGTGIVHLAPAFGEDDFTAARNHRIPLVCPIDTNGLFDKQVPPFTGRLWSDCQKEIIREMKTAGRLFHQTTLRHRYPFCYRTDTPLIYRATETWFMSVEKIKDRLVEQNRTIEWIPEHIREGRFGKWLENAKDWAISRTRFWGTPIPLWQAEDGDLIVVGSCEELYNLTGRRFDDIHRHFLDSVPIERENKIYRRIDAVFDCWFESGSMPYAQKHYPFEEGQTKEDLFTADFIAEGVDQTRGWFYTLHVLSCALFERKAFSHVIVNGIVLAEDGHKMSKRLQNYPDPQILLEKYGADALRLYFFKSPVVRGEDLAFSETGVEALLKQFLLPLWNSYSFFITYARLYHWHPETRLPFEDLPALDRWILSQLQSAVEKVRVSMESYRLGEAVDSLGVFIENMTNWYIRRSRRRFWSSLPNNVDRNGAMQTLFVVLQTLCKAIAPFAPFISEAIYRNLKSEEEPDSVHLQAFPQTVKSWIDRELEASIALLQKLASMGHALRKEHRLRVRQPLRQAWVLSTSGKIENPLGEHLGSLQEELNIKTIHIEGLSWEACLKRVLKPQFKRLGPRAGSRLAALQKKIGELSKAEIAFFEKEGSCSFSLEGELFSIEKEDLVVHYEPVLGKAVRWQEGFALVLDTELDPELLLEGMARELINKVNTLRKEQNFEISDRIDLFIAPDSEKSSQLVSQMIIRHGPSIQEEILAVECMQGDLEEWQLEIPLLERTLEEFSVKIFIKRALGTPTPSGSL